MEGQAIVTVMRLVEVPFLIALVVLLNLPYIAAYCVGRTLDRLAYGGKA